MRVPSLVAVLVVSLCSGVSFVSAQERTAMSAAEIAATCAPPASATRAAHALRIMGAQDPVPRTMFGPNDIVVVNGGTDAGVELGAQFFVRRTLTSHALTGGPADADVVTDGWIRIVAVNESTSVARVERTCGPIFANDFLEPFAPVATTVAADSAIEPDFSNLARVVGGIDGHRMAGTTEVLILDRGAEQGVEPGARFAIYRDLTASDPMLAAPEGTPLAPIGEVVVLNTTADRAVARIVRARDAVYAGDYAAPQKK